MYQVFEFIDGQFKRPLETFVSDGTSNIAQWVTGPLTVAVTLYVVLYGYLILRGSVQEPILDFAFRAIKLAIIVMLVKNAGEYQTYVTNIFFDVLPREIAQALNSGTAPSASTFDSLLDKGQASATDIWSRASWPVDIITGVGGIMVIFVSFLRRGSVMLFPFMHGWRWRSSWRSGRFSLRLPCFNRRAVLPSPGSGSSQTS